MFGLEHIHISNIAQTQYIFIGFICMFKRIYIHTHKHRNIKDN